MAGAQRLPTHLLVSRLFSLVMSVSVVACFPVRTSTHRVQGMHLSGQEREAGESRSLCQRFLQEQEFGAGLMPLPGVGLLLAGNHDDLTVCLFLPSREDREDPDGVPALLRGPVWRGPLQQHAPRDRGHGPAAGPAALAQGEQC